MKKLLLSILFISPSIIAMETSLPCAQTDNQKQLLKACAAGCAEQTKDLLALATGANCVDVEGRTPLVLAAWNGHTELVNMLLKEGAKQDHRSMQGNTALVLAACSAHPNVVKLLVNRASKKDLKEALEWAIFFESQCSDPEKTKYAEIVTLLRNAGA